MRLVISALAALLCANPALAAPRVIASVVPVHGIVSAVMDGIGQPQLLLRGSLSEHRASFTTSQIIDLGRADLVFIVGHGLEAKLAQLSGSETVNGKRFVELSAAPGVTTLPIRRGGAWDPHQHEAEAADDHGEEAEGVLAFSWMMPLSSQYESRPSRIWKSGPLLLPIPAPPRARIPLSPQLRQSEESLRSCDSNRTVRVNGYA